MNGFPFGLLFLAILESPDERQGHGLQGTRLFNIVPGPVLDGQLGSIRSTKSCDDDNFGSRRCLSNPRQNIQTIPIGHLHVQKNDIKRLRTSSLEPFVKSGSAGDAVPHALHRVGNRVTNQPVIVDNQNVGHGTACQVPTFEFRISGLNSIFDFFMPERRVLRKLNFNALNPVDRDGKFHFSPFEGPLKFYRGDSPTASQYCLVIFYDGPSSTNPEIRDAKDVPIKLVPAKAGSGNLDSVQRCSWISVCAGVTGRKS